MRAFTLSVCLSAYCYYIFFFILSILNALNYYVYNIIVAHIRELEKNNVVIIDNVLPPSVVHYATLHATN